MDSKRLSIIATNCRLLPRIFSLAALSLSASVFVVFSIWRRTCWFPILLAAFGMSAHAQAWSPFLDPSRAIDWSSAGFTVPNYTVACPTQPSLTAGTGAASANATSIQNALNSCTGTQNVVNIPAGTWSVAKISYGTQGKQVLRGAGPNSTTLVFTAGTSCAGGLTAGICMVDSNARYNGSPEVTPASGTQQCSWTGGLSQGSTTITLSSCGGAPPLNQTIILDQANDTSDTGGIYICDTNIAGCGYEDSNGGNNDGRFLNGATHSQQQVTYVTGVTSLGGGAYTVTISPGVYFSNVRSSQSPGAWWPGMVRNDGLENITIDGSSTSLNTNVGMYDCYQCWVKNIRSLDAGRNHIMLYQSAEDVIRDSYFYESQSHYSESYVVETEESSGFLVENNIFQQVTNPLMFGQGSGAVVDYNYSVGNTYSGANNWMASTYATHNAGNEMTLWEGNNFNGIWGDDAWGSSDQNTLFRNMLIGWESYDPGPSTGSLTNETIPILLRSLVRAYNIVGNVLGQPGYHTSYQAYPTSTNAETGGQESSAIYSVGLSGMDSCAGTVTCDPKTFSTMMRWGNYDTVNAAARWDTTEASPAAVTYLNANFTSSYFSSLAHTLPASLYYSSTPSWWPSGKNWPPVGPDVSAGNIGICASGTYQGSQATAASQCGSGNLTASWASHVTSIPAQDCYLSMGGRPDGSGSVLSFDANSCYYSTGTKSGTGPGSPTGLTGTVVQQ